MSRFIRTAHTARQFPLPEDTSPEDLLEHLNLRKNGRLTNAAVLLFGGTPQRFLISSEIKCAHFHGTQVAKPVPSYQVYKGTVFDLVDHAVDFVLSKIALSVGTRAESVQAPVAYEIPKEIVTEAIVNAVAHRDYTSAGSVQVMLFADRLEIWNPGRLPQAFGYAYLGDWQNRANNRNVEPELVRDWLERQGYGDGVITRALHELDKATALGGSKTLYDANRETYDRLRYGLKVQPGVGQQTVTVWLIDWDNPGSNDFAVAEEVTVTGRNTKRPDLVLYVNGIALGVLELKRSTVSVTEGIRQNLDSQKPEFMRPFFATVHLVMAGKRIRGAALRRDRDAGEVLAALEGGRSSPCRRRQSPAPGAGTALRQGAAPRDRARLHRLRSGRQEDLPSQSVLRRTGSPSAGGAA